ncbi:hypothetical protein BGZ59_000293 [Podila verticillata]|nr:hypothetical protein BGZ59_000293 [Podila verticillata]
MEQQFECGDHLECIEVRQDAQGRYYSQLNDIQDAFPGAARFRVEGKGILFLENDHGQRYSPNRIAFYPGKVVEVVLAGQISHSSSESITSSQNSTLTSTTANIPSSELSKMPVSPPTSPDSDSGKTLIAGTPPYSPLVTLVARRHTSYDTTTSSSTSFTSVSRLSTIELAQQIALIQHQLDSQRAVQESLHAEQMAEFTHLVQLHAEAKQRDEEMHRLVQQANDRLVLVHKKVEAILVQNYELHEYPIPRLFVILPDMESSQWMDRDGVGGGGGGGGGMATLKKWIPRLTDKFRLYFLCECGEHAKADSTTTMPEDASSISHNNTHLANHEGYEISRPSDFMDRYGPYVLGMLQVLRTCLTAAALVSPAVAHLPLMDGLDKVASNVCRSVEDTVKAVEFSICFLETKLATDLDSNSTGGPQSSSSFASLDSTSFRDLKALEGSDLRRLGSFLRNKDEDKVLGNLYRITTPEGHVKWVCLEHYRASYREASMRAFLQVVEQARGTFEPQLRKVTLTLPSFTIAQDFFQRLETAPAVNEMDVTFGWGFTGSELKRLVQGVRQSNVRFCSIDLKDEASPASLTEIRIPGKGGKYSPLLDMMMATPSKLQAVRLAGLVSFADRTTRLSKSVVFGTLRSFHYGSAISPLDQARMASLLGAMPQLMDLSLGHGDFYSYMHPELANAVVGCRGLTKLRLYTFWSENKTPIQKLLGRLAAEGGMQLQELFLFGGYYDADEIHEAAWAHEATLEKLVVDTNGYVPLDFSRIISPIFSAPVGGVEEEKKKKLSLAKPVFQKLHRFQAHLHEAASPPCQATFEQLELTHLKIYGREEGWTVVRHVNWSTLRALHLADFIDHQLDPLWEALEPDTGHARGLESLSISCGKNYTSIPQRLAKISGSLRHLWIGRVDDNVDISWVQSLFRAVHASHAASHLRAFGFGAMVSTKNFGFENTLRQIPGWPEKVHEQFRVYLFYNSTQPWVFSETSSGGGKVSQMSASMFVNGVPVLRPEERERVVLHDVRVVKAWAVREKLMGL